jgi:hypothetical protein
MSDRVAYRPGARSVGGLRQGTHPSTRSAALPRLATQRRGWKWSAARGFREMVLIVGVYSLYDVSRYLVAGDHDGAVSHGLAILRLERDLHLDPEHALNTLFSAHVLLALPADYMYATLHYLVTPLVLIWLWRRHSAAYSSARSVLLVATVLGLVGFSLLPVAPPRMLPGFIDTMAREAHYGWWGSDASAPRGFGHDTNEFAAFPSLHVGWAVWCGWQLVRFARHRSVRVLGGLYPIVIGLVVIGTGNHYLLDVVAGVLVMGLAWVLVRLTASVQWLPWRRPSYPASGAQVTAPPDPG